MLPHHLSLPVETWRWVIRLATLSFTGFDPRTTSPLHDGWYRFRIKRNSDETATKLSASLVSKAWRSIAIEYLFETLHFDLDKLANKAAQGDLAGPMSGPNTPFRHTRHADAYHGYDTAADPEKFQALIRVLGLCSDLRIFEQTLEGVGQNPSFFAAFLSTCGGPLQRWEIRFCTVPASFAATLTAMGQNLQFLLFDGTDLPLTAQRSTIISLPSLKTLILFDFDFLHTFQWSVPNLWQFAIGYPRVDEFDDEDDEDDVGPLIFAEYPRDLRILDIGCWGITGEWVPSVLCGIGSSNRIVPDIRRRHQASGHIPPAMAFYGCLSCEF